MSAGSLGTRLEQDAEFFDSMLGLVPPLYLHPPEQDVNNKFMHSKSEKVAPRQSIKENSKQGLKAKAKFDPKNYTSVLTQASGPANGKPVKAESDEEMDGDDDDEEEDGEEDEDDEEEEEEAKPRGAAANRPAAPAARLAPAAKAAPGASSTSVLLAGAPLSTLLPVPALAAISADVGMDQLRQRLHERINGLSNKRKPEDRPNDRKRRRLEAAAEEKKKKKREKNDKKPSQHRTKHTKEDAENGDSEADQPPAKKQKSSSLAHPSSNPTFQAHAASTSPSLKPTAASSSSSSTTGVRASDLLDSNDFQFASLKPLPDPSVKSGSYSLQGVQQRSKKKSDAALLAEVESFRARVSALRAAGASSEADQLENARRMSTALKRASGERVREDPALLKKALKREAKKKEQSREAWAERVEKQKATQDAFHAAKIASASKKQKGDRSKQGGTEADEQTAAAKEKTGRGGGGDRAPSGKKPQGRAGFEGKSGKKKFLN